MLRLPAEALSAAAISAELNCSQRTIKAMIQRSSYATACATARTPWRTRCAASFCDGTSVHAARRPPPGDSCRTEAFLLRRTSAAISTGCRCPRGTFRRPTGS
ncbi:hypothetical protein ACFWVU_00220 [Streptomyces sp. NPDC058686]|uniref:hypothetical protein n=1 Tax=Streptomyces sp. NPDC058686 TaxID=3346599 RepID=UPI003666332A